jgi:hypothetical protein
MNEIRFLGIESFTSPAAVPTVFVIDLVRELPEQWSSEA